MSGQVRVGRLIGSGRMGAFHGETLARRIPGRGWPRWPTRRRARPSGSRPSWGRTRRTRTRRRRSPSPEVDAVVIAAPARFHADLVVAAAAAGKAVFCEKPMAADARRRWTGRSTPRAPPASCCRSGSTAASPPDWRRRPGPARRRHARHPAAAAVGDPRPRRLRPVPRRAEHDLQRDPDPRLRRAAVPQPRRRGGRGVRHRGRAGRARLARQRACSTPRWSS